MMVGTVHTWDGNTFAGTVRVGADTTWVLSGGPFAIAVPNGSVARIDYRPAAAA
jgi:hypothetical protein